MKRNANQAVLQQVDLVMNRLDGWLREFMRLPQEVRQKMALVFARKLNKSLRKCLPNDLRYHNALDCCRVILEENGNGPMHFSDLARQAMDRGYKGKARGARAVVESRTVHSFWASLHRSKDFVYVPPGCYKLAKKGET